MRVKSWMRPLAWCSLILVILFVVDQVQARGRGGGGGGQGIRGGSGGAHAATESANAGTSRFNEARFLRNMRASRSTMCSWAPRLRGRRAARLR